MALTREAASAAWAEFSEFAHAAPHFQRLTLWHAPKAPPRALVVYAHPLADEMNKARRMAAMQSRALVEVGLAVLQIDLLGCGDSSGDFSDASWPLWTQDIVAASRLGLQRCQQQWPGTPLPPLWLWGLRAGALLCSAAAARLDTPVNLLLWQPVHTGKQALQQFLRLRLAAAGLAQGDSRAEAEQVKQDLAAGRPVDVAGYRLSAALAQGLEQAVLTPGSGRVVWLEVAAKESPALLPVSQSTVDRWRQQGLQVDAQAVHGPAFWSTVEIEDAPGLIEATTRLMAEEVLV
jgi:uncharacterized protein